MPLKSGARIRETSITTGIGTYTLDGAPAGFQAFSTLGNDNLCAYFATDGTNWEEGIGTVLTGPNRLARTHVLASSNAGAAVNWGVGTRTLRCAPIGALAVPRMLSKGVAGGVGTTVLTQDEQRNNVLEFTGALTGNRTIEVDATPWNWIVRNNTTGAFSLTLKVTGQTGVVVPQGRRAVVLCDGTDVRDGAGIPGGSSSEFSAGDKAVFNQTAAPLGWTKDTTHDNKALRVVTGTVGSGGATGFTSVFGAGKSAGGTALSSAQVPGTEVRYTGAVALDGQSGGLPGEIMIDPSSSSVTGQLTGTVQGSGGSHDHALSLDLQYADVIVSVKS